MNARIMKELKTKELKIRTFDMKKKAFFILPILFIFFIGISYTQVKSENNLVLKTSYPGQKVLEQNFENQILLNTYKFDESYDAKKIQTDIVVEMIDELGKWFPEQMEGLNIPGAVISVFANDRVIWEKIYGYISRVDHIQIDADTLFCIRSISKSITALAVLMAVQEGLVDLDTPITHYLPDFKVNSCFENNPENKITLRYCLSHRAGFSHEPLPGINVNDDDFFLKYIESISDTWLQFPVGYRFAYSNFGYDLAGHIIQVCSGKLFSQYVKEKVLVPLGMTSSTFDYRIIKKEKNRALGHASADDHVILPFPEIYSAGLFSNIGDMVKYARFHLNNGLVNEKRVLREDLMEQFHSLQFALKNQGTGYTLGLFRELVSNTYSLYHSGGGRGFRSLLMIFPELNIGTMILTNSNDHQLTEMQGRNLINHVIIRRLGPNPVAALDFEKLIPLDNQDPRIKAILGRYNDGMSHVIDYEDKNPVLRLEGERSYPLIFYESNGNLMATYGQASLIEIIPSKGKQPMLLMLSSRRYNNSNIHYVAFNDSPSDPSGPNKPEWRKYEGKYELIWEGIFLNTITIEIKNGYLYYQGRKCNEYMPGLFFTNDGEALDFRFVPPTAANLVLKLKKNE